MMMMMGERLADILTTYFSAVPFERLNATDAVRLLSTHPIALTLSGNVATSYRNQIPNTHA